MFNESGVQIKGYYGTLSLQHVPICPYLMMALLAILRHTLSIAIYMFIILLTLPEILDQVPSLSRLIVFSNVINNVQ